MKKLPSLAALMLMVLVLSGCKSETVEPGQGVQDQINKSKQADEAQPK